MKIIWSPTALNRLSSILEYIRNENSGAVERWINAIFSSVAHLEDFPESGRIVPEVNDKTIREIVFKKYRIIYSIKKDEINILTIRLFKRLLDNQELWKS